MQPDGRYEVKQMSLTRNYEQDCWSLSEDGRKLLTVKEAVVDGTVVMTLAGTLRSDMEHVFRDELLALMTVGMNVVLDCGQLQYIAGTCQDALLSVQQTADNINRGTLTLRHVPPAILAELEKTNLHELLMIE